jgi:hypothetical protein
MRQRGEEGFGGGVMYLDMWTIELEIVLGYPAQFGIALHIMCLTGALSQMKSIDAITCSEVDESGESGGFKV